MNDDQFCGSMFVQKFCGLSIISQLFEKNFAFEISTNERVDEFVQTIAVTGDLEGLQTECATSFEGRHRPKTFLLVFVALV